MELIGEMEGVSDKSWYRCSKCRRLMFISLEALRDQDPSQENKIEKKDCIPYSPEKMYNVGQKIVHQGWNDVGKVITKERTSSGAQAIIVAFEKLGERRLIENLNLVEEPPITPSVSQPAGGTNGQAPKGTNSSTNPVGGDTSW